MPTLKITVRWLGEPPTAGYHGAEWPPSPVRLFRALLAGAQRPGGSGERGREALQRLSECSAPAIEAAEASRMEPVKTAVPNNDSDRIAEAYRKGQAKLARMRWAALRTMRQREGWLVPSAVHYRWSMNEADPDPDAFDRLADDLTLLGQGTDLAVATAEWYDTAPPPVMPTWRPGDDGPVLLPVADGDELRRLAENYQAQRTRIRPDGVRGLREPAPSMAAYHDPMGPPPYRWQAFRLRTPDGSEPWSKDGRDSVRLAGMVRHAVQDAATAAGLDHETVTALMGHGGEGRLYTLPVPNTGHRYADGRVRRVILAAPPAVSDHAWDAIRHRLVDAELIAEGTTQPEAILTPIVDSREDRLLWRFTGASRSWVTSLPALLTGPHHRRGKPRPVKAVRRLLEHAGIPFELVEHVELESAASVAGAGRARDYFVPNHLNDKPRAWIRLVFHRPVHGPLVLGAGAGYGLGLLQQCERSSRVANAGKRSQNANSG